MKKRNPVAIGLGLVVLLSLVTLAWWLVSPLFINKTVEEAFPVVQGEGMVTAVDDMAMDKEEMMDDMAMDKEEMMDDMAMDEDKMMDDMAMDEDKMMDDMAIDETMMDEATQEDNAPILLKQGIFRNGGNNYSGSGQADIYRLPDGSHVLRLEDFSVTNGPDLYVVLANHPDPSTNGALHSQAIIELERLKGNQGSQNYLIPASVEIASLGSVVIYCKAFSVIFSVASLHN